MTDMITKLADGSYIEIRDSSSSVPPGQYGQHVGIATWFRFIIRNQDSFWSEWHRSGDQRLISRHRHEFAPFTLPEFLELVGRSDLIAEAV